MTSTEELDFEDWEVELDADRTAVDRLRELAFITRIRAAQEIGGQS